MARQEPVTRWRSMTWAADLVAASGLKPDQLELKLYNEIERNEFRTPTGIMRDYLSGRKATNFETAGAPGRSLILTGEALYPGTMWSYCAPIFDALDEAFYWERPKRAMEKFLDRVGDERRSAAKQRGETANALPQADAQRASVHQIEDMNWRCTGGRVRDVASSRIRRIRAAMLGLPTFHRLDMFSAAPALEGGVCRTVQPIAAELAVVLEPYKRDDLALCALLMLEALAMEDLDRWAESVRRLCSLKSATPGLFGAQVSEGIWGLLEQVMQPLDFPRYQVDFLRSRRAYAHIHAIDLIENDAAMNAICLDIDAHGVQPALDRGLTPVRYRRPPFPPTGSL